MSTCEWEPVLLETSFHKEVWARLLTNEKPHGNRFPRMKDCLAHSSTSQAPHQMKPQK